MEAISARGGTPVVFPSHGLNALDDDEWVAAHDALGRRFDRFIGFELGPMFVPYGRIYSLDAYEGLLGVRELHRRQALVAVARSRVGPPRGARPGPARLPRVHRQRPRHRHGVYGSDYLLGLSAFAPEAFAERDRRWAHGDRDRSTSSTTCCSTSARFAFRAPVPAYRHDAALFLQLRGRIESDATPPGAPRRPESDRAVLADIAERLEALL